MVSPTVHIATPHYQWRRGLYTSSTAPSLPAYNTLPHQTVQPEAVDSSSDPTGNYAVFANPYNNFLLQFFGTGADGATFNAAVFGWALSPAMKGKSETALWRRTYLVKLDLTLSLGVGIASSTQATTERDADTLVVGSGGSLTSGFYQALSPANNTPASIWFDGVAFPYISVHFALGTATAANVWAGNT